MKKKILAIFVILSLCLTTSIPVVFAKDITVNLNGNKISFDVPPQITNDRTMVPMRAIFEALGYSVNWDDLSKKITATGLDGTITMTVDNKTFYKNGNSYTSDVAPIIINDRTMVPLRALGESLGARVVWSGNNATVYISTDKTVYSEQEAIAIVQQQIENSNAEFGDFSSVIPYYERFKLNYYVSNEFYFDDCYIIHAETTTINPGGTGSYKVYKNSGEVEYLGIYVSESMY